MDSQNQIAFEQLGLGSVLKQNQLIVPANQREYSWSEREVQQLFQDFGRALNEGDYFLGTIVTIPRATGVLEVVDGQQRLATTALLLSAIRDYLNDQQNEDVLVESINNEFLTGIDRSARARVSKLTLNIDDRDLFNCYVSGTSSSDAYNLARASHERLHDAYLEAKTHVRSIVTALDPKDHGDLLNTWVSFIEHRALVVLLRVPDDADAYRMFETLNDRGLRTSQADLIKNYIFGKSGNRIGEVQSRWSYMRGALESLEEEDITVNFLRHSLITQHGYLREAQVYEKVQEVVRAAQPAVTFSTSLESLANTYVASFNPEHERWNDYPMSVRRAIEVFNLLNIRPLRPLILAAAAKMNAQETSKTFNLLVSVGVRLLIASTTRSASVEVPLANAANLTYKGEIETASKLKTNINSIIPTNAAFREAFSNARVSNARFARYYLRSMELQAEGVSEPWFMPVNDPEVINLEHILPKKPMTNWPTFDPDTARLYASRLGNQTLMRASDNSSIHSDAFADKREVYKVAPYELTRQIYEYGEWTPATIGKRQEKLADWAIKTWPT